MRPLRFVLPLALFALLAGLLAKGLSLDPREVPSPLLGKRAPSFALSRLDDPARTLRSDELRGRVWMLNVWASWCAACRDEHPLLLRFAADKRVPLLGLDHKDQRADAQQWLARLGNPYDVSLSDADGRVGIDFGVYGVPETFIIDRSGVIRFKHIGALTPQVLRERVEPLLRQLEEQ